MAKKSGFHTEERLLQLAHVLSPDMEELERAKAFLDRVRCEFMDAFIDAFTAGYSQEGVWGTSFNNKAFAADLEQEKYYRVGVRRMAAPRVALDDSSAEVVGDGAPDARCIIQ